jgi:hypothetical protein
MAEPMSFDPHHSPSGEISLRNCLKLERILFLVVLLQFLTHPKPDKSDFFPSLHVERGRVRQLPDNGASLIPKRNLNSFQEKTDLKKYALILEINQENHLLCCSPGRKIGIGLWMIKNRDLNKYPDY